MLEKNEGNYAPVVAFAYNRAEKIERCLATQKEGLYYDNAIQDKNSTAWKNIMEAYPKCREMLINNIRQ